MSYTCTQFEGRGSKFLQNNGTRLQDYTKDHNTNIGEDPIKCLNNLIFTLNAG
jgi:hypothetical protein